MKLINSIARQL